MVSKQTSEVEEASSVTIAAGRVENAMLGFRERDAAATRPAALGESWRSHHRHLLLHDLAVVLIGPHGFAERQAARDQRSRVGLRERLQDSATAATRLFGTLRQIIARQNQMQMWDTAEDLRESCGSAR